LPSIGEEENVVVGGGGEHRLHIVLLPGGHGADALAAPALGVVFRGGQPLDIAVVGEGEHAVLLGDEVLVVDVLPHVLDLGLALVAVFVPDLHELGLEHGLDLLGVGQQLLVIGDLLSRSLYSASSFSRLRPCRAMRRISQMAWACTSSRPKRSIRFCLALS
jgi:hypothetical protein